MITCMVDTIHAARRTRQRTDEPFLLASAAGIGSSRWLYNLSMPSVRSESMGKKNSNKINKTGGSGRSLSGVAHAQLIGHCHRLPSTRSQIPGSLVAMRPNHVGGRRAVHPKIDGAANGRRPCSCTTAAAASLARPRGLRAVYICTSLKSRLPRMRRMTG